MVQLAPKNPLILLNLYLDDGERNLAGKTKTFKGVDFSKKTLSFGVVDRSISYPPGEIQVNDATIECDDTDGEIKAWFDAITPFRRLGEIILEYEQNSDLAVLGRAETGGSGDREHPIPPGSSIGSGFITAVPSSDPMLGPLYTGEITDYQFPDGRALITLHDATTAWLNRFIPKLLTRDAFPNMPPDLESAFSPIIFGNVESVSSVGEPQGVILCPHVDAVLNRFNVARHTCHAVHTVYRKKYLEATFRVVNPAEYTIVTQVITFGVGPGAVTYTFTHIQFFATQPIGTVIHADVSGVNFHIDFDTGALVYGGEHDNPSDALMTLMYFILQTEVRIGRYNGQSFKDLWTKMDHLGYRVAGAFTDNLNVGLAQGITNGQALLSICQDFGIDFYQSNRSEITVKYWDPHPDTDWMGDWDASTFYFVGNIVFVDIATYRCIVSNSGNPPATSPTFWEPYISDQIVPIDEHLTLLGSVMTGAPTKEKIKNRLRYRYYRQNAGLTEFVRSSNTGQWGAEEELDNVTDQDEMTNALQNPLLEEEVELRFVRDPDIALALMKRRMGWHNLRSYIVEFDLPAPEVVQYLGLTSAVGLTHYNGIGPDGWVDVTVKIIGIAIDLQSYVAHCRGVRYITVPDASLVGPTPGITLPDPMIRYPHLPVMINGNELIPPEIDVQSNFNDTTPPAPEPPPPEDPEALSEDAAFWTTFYQNAGYDPGAALAAGKARAGPKIIATVVNQNVKWQEDATVHPRLVSGYVSMGVGGGGEGITVLIGTLVPDTRPGPDDLTDAEIFLVQFHAWDYNHTYWWVGHGETFGTGSGWMIVDGDEPGRIEFRIDTPGSKGWKLCDGSTGVPISDYQGDVVSGQVPNMIDSYPKGALTYSGATPVPGTPSTQASMTPAPSHSHGGSSVGSHTHTIGGSSGPGTAHTHTTTLIIDTDFAGAHSHGGFTVGAGAHNHGGLAFATMPDHQHNIPLLTTGSSEGGHSHSVSTSGTFNATLTDCEIVAGEESAIDVSVVGCGAGVSGGVPSTGSTTSSGTHQHTTEGDTSFDGGGITFNPVIPTQTSHFHPIDNQADHFHDIITTENTIFSESLHTHPMPANTGGGSGTISIVPDGSHSHTVVLNANGEPTHTGLKPYMRI